MCPNSSRRSISGRPQANSTCHMPIPESGLRSVALSSPFGPNDATCPSRHLRPEPTMTFQRSESPAAAIVGRSSSESIGAALTISISTAPCVSGHSPRSLAGNTFVSFTTRRSFGVMYSTMSAMCRCSITPVSRCSTIIFSVPRLSAGCCATSRAGSGYQNCRVFISLLSSLCGYYIINRRALPSPCPPRSPP